LISQEIRIVYAFLYFVKEEALLLLSLDKFLYTLSIEKESGTQVIDFSK